MTGIRTGRAWPDSLAVIGAVSDALRGKLVTVGDHPALVIVCGMALLYRERREDNQRLGAPPAAVNWDQAEGPVDTNPTELRLCADFDRIAGAAFDLGSARPGVLAARVAYWTICANIPQIVSATRAYDDCITRLKAAPTRGEHAYL
ncbi:hypothetical protein [Nocardia miyunensis]|uniref:hypothetical protein n=1 Tax=Nocardia miyunensis TaxID=282684 RepID=UPI00082F48FB|nr:hypothetical protein [Nocardia miyunensis]